MIGCIIQARMGSSRLPGKVLMKIDSQHTILEFVINQLKSSNLIDQIVIATTNLKEDDEIEKFSCKMNVKCFRGNTTNVLDRYFKCAKKFNFSTIVRITADCPLIDPQIVDKVIMKFNEGHFDYVSNKLNRTFPQGTETEVFSFKSFTQVWHKAKNLSEREHVTPYYYTNNFFKIASIQHTNNISNLRWTIDRINDLNFIQKVVSLIESRPILLHHILDVLSTNPNLIEINKDHIIDEGYKKSVKNETLE